MVLLVFLELSDCNLEGFLKQKVLPSDRFHNSKEDSIVLVIFRPQKCTLSCAFTPESTECTINKGLAIACPQPGCHSPNSP